MGIIEDFSIWEDTDRNKAFKRDLIRLIQKHAVKHDVSPFATGLVLVQLAPHLVSDVMSEGMAIDILEDMTDIFYQHFEKTFNMRLGKYIN